MNNLEKSIIREDNLIKDHKTRTEVFVFPVQLLPVSRVTWFVYLKIKTRHKKQVFYTACLGNVTFFVSNRNIYSLSRYVN